MTALDTDILVRVLTNDNPEQVRAARDLLGSDESVVVPVTVFLQTGWVLEAVYELERSVVVDSLRDFLGLPSVEVDRPHEVAQALDWYEGGLDLADAVHLALSQEADRLATFDRAFARDATDYGRCSVISISS